MINIVIVNWNSGKLLHNCLESIRKFESVAEVKTIVVDNASVDGSDKTAYQFSGVSVVHASENLGFAKACNLGAKACSGDYLLFLNPDATLFPTTLDRAVAYMQKPSNAKVGICGVQLIDETGQVARSCARFPKAMTFFLHSIGLVHFQPLFGYFMTEWPHDQTREVDHVIGAFFLVRRSLFDKLGGFDERFFVYLEDLDFSYRSHQAGWKTVYLAEAQAFHVGGGTSNQVKARRLFYSLRSRLLYSFKHFSFIGAMAVLLVALLLEPLSRSALALGRRSFTTFQETWSGYGMLWRWLPQWIFKGVTR